MCALEGVFLKLTEFLQNLEREENCEGTKQKFSKCGGIGNTSEVLLFCNC